MKFVKLAQLLAFTFATLVVVSATPDGPGIPRLALTPDGPGIPRLALTPDGPAPSPKVAALPDGPAPSPHVNVS
jgi:hypothetical protein